MRDMPQMSRRAFLSPSRNCVEPKKLRGWGGLPRTLVTLGNILYDDAEKPLVLECHKLVVEFLLGYSRGKHAAPVPPELVEEKKATSEDQSKAKPTKSKSPIPFL